jgi:hypothetical protein
MEICNVPSFLASEQINNADLKGPLLGENTPDLINLFKGHNTYVNVHSKSYIDGEIRREMM